MTSVSRRHCQDLNIFQKTFTPPPHPGPQLRHTITQKPHCGHAHTHTRLIPLACNTLTMDELHADAHRLRLLFLPADRNRRHLIKCFRLSRRQVEATQPRGLISKVTGECARVSEEGEREEGAASRSLFINFTFVGESGAVHPNSGRPQQRGPLGALSSALCLLWACALDCCHVTL